MLKKLLRANTIALLAITAVLGCAPDSSHDAVSPTEAQVEVVSGGAAGANSFTRITENPAPGLPLSVSGIIGLLGGVMSSHHRQQSPGRGQVSGQGRDDLGR